jgi:hypothetical protein
MEYQLGSGGKVAKINRLARHGAMIDEYEVRGFARATAGIAVVGVSTK